MSARESSVWVCAAVAAVATSAWTSPCADARPVAGSVAAAVLVLMLRASSGAWSPALWNAGAALAVGFAAQAAAAGMLARGVDLPLVSEGASALLAPDYAGRAVSGGFWVKGLDGSFVFRGIAAKALLPEILATLAAAAVLRASGPSRRGWAAYHVTAASFVALAVARVALIAGAYSSTHQVLVGSDSGRLGVFWDLHTGSASLVVLALVASRAWPDEAAEEDR